ncbi:UbiA family prenyltransferase (plasmid) [Embleya sp. NBC_00888]|uniref:SCO3242 family prenyltransferase n=1 Tax=Embleya sp. NBC_00888 TaxID=2975960 RepID=UPI002F91BA39|nr:UbiA family prenyltransferase [Embleya sp. NBC_00888]
MSAAERPRARVCGPGDGMPTESAADDTTPAAGTPPTARSAPAPEPAAESLADRGDRPGVTTRVRAYAELVRVSAASSVPGDVLVGAAATGRLPHGRTAALPLASVCLYWAGMALNDYADRASDADERPHRPIPSGRVAPGAALGAAVGLTATGLTLGTWAGGRRRLPALLGLAGAVWTYDLIWKGTPFAPAGMALARGLDVLVGAEPGRYAPAAPSAAVVALHTYGLTALSRHEEHGTTPEPPARALVTAAATAIAAARIGHGRRTGDVQPADRGGATPASAAALIAYAAAYGRPLLRASAAPRAPAIRAAVGGGVLALIPLQAALLSRLGRPGAALALSASWPLGRALTRHVSPT